jgi:anti-sigma B factor antagonist
MLRCAPDFLLAKSQTQIGPQQMNKDEDEGPPRSQDDAPLRRVLRPSGPVSLTLTESRRPGVTIVEVAGELDLLTAPRVAAQLDEMTRARGRDDVVVDLRATEFIDSAGLYILLSAKRRLNRLGRDLTVVSDTGPVRRMLELSRLIEALGVTTDLEDPPAS